LQAGDYENGNGGKRRVSRLTQFIHATLQLITTTCETDRLINQSRRGLSTPSITQCLQLHEYADRKQVTRDGIFHDIQIMLYSQGLTSAV